MTKFNKLNFILATLLCFLPAAHAHTAKGSGLMQEATMALRMSAHATLRDLQAAQGFEALLQQVAEGKMGKMDESLLTLDAHAFSKETYNPPSTLMATMKENPDLKIGEMLANVSPDLRERYILEIADVIGELSETNEAIASYYFELAAWSTARSWDMFIAENMSPDIDPEGAAAFKLERMAEYRDAIPGEFLVGDAKTFNFLRELLIRRPLEGKPQAVEIAEALLETLGSDSRLFRSGLLTIFAADLSLAPGSFGRDKKYARLVEIATRITRKLQAPYWHISCAGLLAAPVLN